MTRRPRRNHTPASRAKVALAAMEAAFCVEVLEEALARHGRPQTFNTDQGSQFTSQESTGVPLKNHIAISMDGRLAGS